MLTREEVMEIRVLHRQGMSIRGIARATGVSRNVVRRYLRSPDAPRYKRRAARRSKLDPYKSYIAERLRAAAPSRIPATALLIELRARGYEGGITILKEFAAGFVPAKRDDPVVRFETEPGQQMQVDWAVIGRGPDRLSVFVATLGWSRSSYVEFCEDEKVETLILAHEHAFAAFGGIPAEVLYDNVKTVVLERNTYGRGHHRFHSAFLDYAGHAGFVPRLCRPYRAKTKGKVERFIRYLKESFWVPFASGLKQAGLRPDKDAANAAVARWLREIANARLHGTTGEVPAERLKFERGKLRPLPRPYGGRSVRQVQTARMQEPIVGYQHPLSLYEELVMGSAA
jgi:transposase